MYVLNRNVPYIDKFLSQTLYKIKIFFKSCILNVGFKPQRTLNLSIFVLNDSKSKEMGYFLKVLHFKRTF